MPFSLGRLLVPGAAAYRPVWVAFGVVAAELLAALAVTNHYRKRLPNGLWRRLHMLNLAVWALALVHGLTAGTDASTTWALVLYAGSAWPYSPCSSTGSHFTGTPTIHRKEHAMAMGRKVFAGAAAALAVGGAGAGVAATKLTTNSPSEESKAIVNDAAKSLGVEPSKLSAALKKAYEDRIDAAVADGRLTKQQGAELKQRIESGDFPLFGPPGFGRGPGGPHALLHGLDAAASYLGLTEDAAAHPARERQDPGRGGQGAGQVRGRPRGRDGQGRHGEARRRRQGGPAHLGAGAAILTDLKQHIDDLVNGKLPDRFPGRRGFGFRDRQGPPAAFADPAA